jgi:hypothetical protein
MSSTCRWCFSTAIVRNQRFKAIECVAMIVSIAHQADSLARAAFDFNGTVEYFLDTLRELARISGRI